MGFPPPLLPPRRIPAPPPPPRRECERDKARSVRGPLPALNVPFERPPPVGCPPLTTGAPLAGPRGCSSLKTPRPGPAVPSVSRHHHHVPAGLPPAAAAHRAARGAGSAAGVPDPRVHGAGGVRHGGLAGHPVLQLLVQRVDLRGHLHHLALPGRGIPGQHLHLPLRQGPALHRRRGQLQGAHGVGGEPAAQGRLHRHPQPGAHRQRHLHLRRQEPPRHRGQVLAGHALRAGEGAAAVRRGAGLGAGRGAPVGGRAGGPGLRHPLLLAAAPGPAAAAPQRHGEGEAAALGQGRLQARPAGPGALRHAGPRPGLQEGQGRAGRFPAG